VAVALLIFKETALQVGPVAVGTVVLPGIHLQAVQELRGKATLVVMVPRQHSQMVVVGVALVRWAQLVRQVRLVLAEWGYRLPLQAPR
jgi:hypothetical protein